MKLLHVDQWCKAATVGLLTSRFACEDCCNMDFSLYSIIMQASLLPPARRLCFCTLVIFLIAGLHKRMLDWLSTNDIQPNVSLNNLHVEWDRADYSVRMAADDQGKAPHLNYRSTEQHLTSQFELACPYLSICEEILNGNILHMCLMLLQMRPDIW